MKSKDICQAPEGCQDCMDLHWQNIQHKCHCHYREPEKNPNLGDLVDKEITGVFYVRSVETKEVVGLKIMTQGSELTIMGKELKINYGRSI